MFGRFTTFLAAATAATTIEDGLYGAAVPADAVFVRRMDDGDGPLQVLGRQFLAHELPHTVYAAISASDLTGADQGRYYSVIARPDGTAHIVAEPPRADRSRVHLILLNMGTGTARMTVADDGAVVINDTAPMAANARAVNPVAVTLRVETAHGAQTFPVTLRRGQNVTFVVTESGISLVPSAFGPVIAGE